MSFQDLARPIPVASSPERSLSLQIFKINANVQGIRSLAENIGTPRDSASLRLRLRDLTESTRALAQRASEQMKELVADTPQSPALRKIISDLDASLRAFQLAQRLSVDRQRINLVPVALPELIPSPLVDVESSAQIQMQEDQVVSMWASEAAYRDAEILERRSAIMEIEQSMSQVAEIVRELGVIVERQGGDIATVESNIHRSARDLERGADELEVAVRHRRRARRTCLTLILGVVCAVVLVAVLM
ncbi:t-SNARE [Mycena metata]|uniref:t-SNARE n=1 Tax=Mycena metata TaxID=1033252 RepID=A0AAD7JHZ1_9AGAR|nr:t-SNARE [Mycena metata]